MEFWSENQGQSHLYSNFGTVPAGRNCTHNYHDRYQATHYPLHYGELQDRGRESSYLTLAGSRTGRAPQKYTNWMGQELTAPAPSNSYPRRDLGEYQPHEARDKEWTVAQRAVREYESGLLREGWQRRWEACSPDHYNGELSAKRSDGSYRELEAWAARYSHSLPRRRRIEAEWRASSQGMLESSRAPERDSRSGTDPQVAALQQFIQSANIRESGLWDRRSRQHALTNYTSHTPITGTSHTLDVNDKTGYKRRTVGHPPGYIAPPPYNSPHKGSPVVGLHDIDTSGEREDKRQTYWSQPTIRNQDVSMDPRKGDKKDFTKPDVTQCSLSEQQRPETDALQPSSPVSFQRPHIKPRAMLSLRWPPALQAAQGQKINEEASQKVIEGRKFRLNKKTGGMTIFCLVSRIAGTTEAPSLPLCTSETNTARTDLGGVSEGLWDSGDVNQTHTFADEVDFGAPTLAEQSNISDVKNLRVTQEDTQTCREKELTNKAETVIISPEKSSTNDADSAFGRHVSQPPSVKYPLWREPNFTSRLETESSSIRLTANNEEGEPDVLQNKDISAEIHPTDIEVRRLDIKKDTKSDDSEGLLVVDTTCVVVKMEVIPSPKKKQVYYFDSTAETHPHSPLHIQSNVSPKCFQSNFPLNHDEATDQSAESDPKYVNERPEMELDSDLAEKKATEGESEIPLPCMSSASAAEKETVEEHAEGTLGIPQHYCMTVQEPRDARSLLDLCADDWEPSPLEDNGIDIAVGEHPRDNQSQVQGEVDQSEDVVGLHETCNPTGKSTNDCGEGLAISQKQISALSEGNNVDSQIRAPTPDTSDSPEFEVTEYLNLGSAGEEGRTEQNQEVEKESYSQHPSQCVSPPTILCNSDSPLRSSNGDAPDPALSLMPPSSDPMSLLYRSESPIEQGPNPESIAHNSTENPAHHPVSLTIPQTPSEQMSSPPPPGATDFYQSSTPHEDPPPGQSLPDLLTLTAEAASGVEDQDEECVTSQLINNEMSDDLGATEELRLQQQFESGKPDDAACAKEGNVTDEHETKAPNKDPTDNIMEQIPGESQDDGTQVNILLECVQEEEVACVTQSSPAEEQLPKEVNEDPIGLMKAAISQEILNKGQTEANILQQRFDNGQEEDASCPKENYMIKEQSQKEACGGTAGLQENTISRKNTADSQTKKAMEYLQDIEPPMEPSHSSPPSPSDFRPSPSLSRLPSPSQYSNKSDTEFVSLSEMDSVCPSTLNPVDDDDALAAAVPETVPFPVHQDFCEESFKSTLSSNSPSVLPSSFTTAVLQEGSGCVSPDSSQEEEPQYPQSLWEAVNRIRRHTAPDSESGEEEASDLWDPESGVEDLGHTDVVDNVDFEKRISDEAEQRELLAEESVDDIAVGEIWQYPCHHESSRHAEGESQSCSSASSHSSEDTVIIDDEDEFEEMTPNAGRETKSVHEEESQSTEGERC